MSSINITGVIGYDTTELDVIRALKSVGDAENITVHINSRGGSVDQGFAIYNALKNHPATITTKGRGNVDSIATVILQAGDRRELEETLESFIIHNVSIDPIYLGESVDANLLKNVEAELRREEDEITTFYQNITGIPFASLDRMMDKETNLTAAQAVELGFADAVFNDKAVMASLYTKSKSKDEMTEEQNKVLNAWETLKNLIFPKKDTKNIVEVTVQENGQRLYLDAPNGLVEGLAVFTMQDGEVTDVPAPDGEHQLTSGAIISVQDGIIVSVSDGGVTETQEEQADNQNDEEMTEEQVNAAIEAAVNAAIKPLQDENAALKEKLDNQAKENSEFMSQLNDHMKTITSNFKIPESRDNTQVPTAVDYSQTSNEAIRKVREQRAKLKNNK